MKSLMITLGVLFSLRSFSQNANFEGDHAYLDRPYENLIHPVDDSAHNKGLSHSDTVAAIGFQSPVKSQGSRGTCSIFSATAMVEAMVNIRAKNGVKPDLNLSEEWLEFLAISSSNATTDGSYGAKNFSLIHKYGMTSEDKLSYISESWEDGGLWGLASERCGHLEGAKLKTCKLSHFDPALFWLTDEALSQSELSGADEILKNKKEATKFRKKYLTPGSKMYQVYGVSEVKARLQAGIPLELGLDFFYGAWNHRKANDLSIGRDLSQWEEGIVGYPEVGSVDYAQSRLSKNRAGHSILVVGYDDNKIVVTKVKMQDGSTKEFTYKGVYYFKNSWGTDSFGAEFSVDDKNFPGYGMITQKYAHQYGSFNNFEL